MQKYGYIYRKSPFKKKRHAKKIEEKIGAKQNADYFNGRFKKEKERQSSFFLDQFLGALLSKPYRCHHTKLRLVVLSVPVSAEIVAEQRKRNQTDPIYSLLSVYGIQLV